MKKLIVLLAFFSCLHVYAQKPKNDLVQFPEYPSYKTVINEYLKRYKSPEIIYPQQFSFAKKPDGWHAMIVQRWPEYKEIKDELFWTRSFNAFLDIGFEKLDDVVENPVIPHQIVDPEDSLYTGILPFYGYMGWEEDIINEYKNEPYLSDNLLNALARAYASYASDLLSNNSGFSDPALRFHIPASQDALSKVQLETYRDYEHKAIDTYKKLRIQNNSYETFISNINIVYSNEILNCFLTLRYYQNNDEARNELKPKLYDPFTLSLARNYLASCDSNAILFTGGDLDTYPLLYVQETEGMRKDILVVNSNLLNSERYVSHLFTQVGKAQPLPVCVDQEIYRQGKKDVIYVLKRDSMQSFYDLKTLISNVESVDITKKYHGRRGYLDYFPGTNLKMAVDKANVIHSAILAPSEADSIVAEMRWSIGVNRKSILINDFIFLDVLSCTDFKRPICFTYGTSPEYFLGLEKYFQCDGLVYKIVPIESKPLPGNYGRMNATVLYRKMMNVFTFDKIEEGTGFKLSNTHLKQIYMYRNQYSRLAEALIAENKKGEARKLLDYCDQTFPSSLSRHNGFSIRMIECYYKIGSSSKANSIAHEMFDNYSIEIDKLLNGGLKSKDYGNVQLSMNVLYDLSRLTNITYPQGKFGRTILEKYSELYRKVNSIIYPEKIRN